MRTLAWTVGSLLVIAALFLAIRGTDFSTWQSANPMDIIGVAALVGLNLIITGLLFWWATLSFDTKPRVSIGRMVGLISASALLNYLPLRVGLFGRAIYLKTHHQLPVFQSGVILFGVLYVSGMVLGAIAVLPLIAPRELWWPTGIAGMIALALLNIWLLPRLLRRPIRGAAWWIVLKLIDALVGGARLWLILAMMGHTMAYADALALGAAGMFISMLGLTPNGLGLREWFIAAMATVLPIDPMQAMSAALIDRAIEVPVIAISGLISLRVLRAKKQSAQL